MELTQEITLSDGRIITVDVTHLKASDWRVLKNPIFSDGEDYPIVSKHTGLSVEEYAELDLQDQRRIVHAIGKLSSTPLSDPS